MESFLYTRHFIVNTSSDLIGLNPRFISHWRFWLVVFYHCLVPPSFMKHLTFHETWQWEDVSSQSYSEDWTKPWVLSIQ